MREMLGVSVLFSISILASGCKTSDATTSSDIDASNAFAEACKVSQKF